LSQYSVLAIAEYLESKESSKLERLTLNNCGLFAGQIAAIFNAMGQGRRMTASVNANPLEFSGLDGLCRAIAFNFSPTALYMEMVEFVQEANYIKLMRSLMLNSTIKLLSLAGTATPSQVSEHAAAALTGFFTHNKTLEYLDLSGYSAKLDEGQLGMSFSRSLAGLGKNTHIQHLRIRNQKLNINVGHLGEALTRNRGLRTLDIQDNDLNLSNLAYLVKSLEENTSIVQFIPFSEGEFRRAIDASIRRLVPRIDPYSTPTPRNSSFPKNQDRSPISDSDLAPGMKPLVAELRDEWSAQTGQMEALLRRNRKKRDDGDVDSEQSGGSMSFSSDSGLYGSIFGGLAAKDAEARNLAQIVSSHSQSSQVGSHQSTPRKGARRSSGVGRMILAPHHVSSEEVMESPMATDGEAATMSSAIPSPPELANSPTDIDTGTNFGPTPPEMPLLTPSGSAGFDASLIALMRRHGVLGEEDEKAIAEDSDEGNEFA
jgi:hypothetical protein